MNNLVSIYRLFAGKLRGCFEYKKSTQSDYNCFMSINNVNTKVYTSRLENKTNLCVLGPYQISQGSLPSLGYSKGVSEIFLNADSIPETVGDFAKLVVNNNEDFAYGDQITVFVCQQDSDATGVDVASEKSFKIELLRNSDDKVADILGTEVKVTNKYLAVTLPEKISAYAFVHSRVTNNQLHVSSQVLELSSDEVLSKYGDPQRAGVTDTAYYVQPNSVNEAAGGSGNGSGSGSGTNQGGSGSGSGGEGIDTGD